MNKRKKIKPKYKIGVLVRTADLKRTFPNSVTTNWSYILYEVTETVLDILPSYRNDTIPERYNEALLKETKLTMRKS